jgi:hypothetical protein
MTATIYNVKGRGLVVLTSCSHRGVINTIRAAMSASGKRAAPEARASGNIRSRGADHDL